MLSIFRKKENKKPKKGSSFYLRENRIQTVDELKKYINLTDSEKLMVTDTLIEFNGLKLKEITLEAIKDLLGEEAFVLDTESQIEGRKVYFFRLTSEHLKFLLQLHFINDEFYMASTMVHGNSLLSENDKKKLTNRIITKYCPDADVDTLTFKIKDPEGNVLYTEDDVFYIINYIANNKLTKELKVKYKNYMPPTSEDSLKETLDELI